MYAAGHVRMHATRHVRMHAAATCLERTALGTARAWNDENLARSSCCSFSTCTRPSVSRRRAHRARDGAHLGLPGGARHVVPELALQLERHRFREAALRAVRARGAARRRRGGAGAEPQALCAAPAACVSSCIHAEQTRRRRANKQANKLVHTPGANKTPPLPDARPTGWALKRRASSSAARCTNPPPSRIIHPSTAPARAETGHTGVWWALGGKRGSADPVGRV
jgi:hypothetical protein